MSIVVGIDASRNRSGGAKAHLIGILTELNPLEHDIREVHVWAFKSLLDAIPNRSCVVKHCPNDLEQSLPRQLWWQANKLSGEVKAADCDILFTTDASTLCRFRPMVVLSQDMLSYEPGVMSSFGFSKARLRLHVILLIQNRAFRFANGVIFLTKYSGELIQKACGQLHCVTYIPHGVGSDFKRSQMNRVWPESGGRPIQCIYVSNAEMYKHQWVVVRAIAALRERGHNLTLMLVGGGAGRSQRLLEDHISILDPERAFVQQLDFVLQEELPGYLVNADLFVFASSCENMPVTLVEAMAVGLPIACSDRGPIPEVLEDGGVYFDPEDEDSIANAVEQIINDSTLRERIAQRAKMLSEQYSWQRCAEETFGFIVETHRSLERG